MICATESYAGCVMQKKFVINLKMCTQIFLTHSHMIDSEAEAFRGSRREIANAQFCRAQICLTRGVIYDLQLWNCLVGMSAFRWLPWKQMNSFFAIQRRIKANLQLFYCHGAIKWKLIGALTTSHRTWTLKCE